MHTLKCIVATLLVGLCMQAPAAEVALSGFSPLYVGVDHATAIVPSNPSSTGAPLTSRAYIVRVNLRAPGIAFTATPQSGPLETTSETTSQFATNMRVRVAVNTNFFAPCCNAFPEPKNVIGTLISNGQVVSAPGSEPGQSEAVLALTRHNRATIADVSEIDFSNVHTAVAGSAIIVKDGVDTSAQSPPQGDPNNPNPRTLAGLSADGRHLYLAVIDGRVTGYSIGTTHAQSAALMLALGCDDALNLDGGGSSELVRADKLGRPFIVNNPSGGAERFSAAALGVHAFPLPFRGARHDGQSMDAW
jgi:exopolysaccharide biosynthesis protein